MPRRLVEEVETEAVMETRGSEESTITDSMNPESTIRFGSSIQSMKRNLPSVNTKIVFGMMTHSEATICLGLFPS